MADTKAAGDIAEAVVLAEFLRAGFPALLPFGDNCRYDLVVEAGGRFLRVQCKTASQCGGRGMHPLQGAQRSAPVPVLPGQADLFGAYSPYTGQVYVLAVNEVPDTDVWLRLMPAKNNQQLKIRRAEDHTLAAWAARQG